MEAQRFIFDLDGTLLTSDPSLERQFFESIYGEAGHELVDQIPELLNFYEYHFPKYDMKMLATYLSKETQFNITPQIVSEWVHILGDVPDTMEEKVEDVLDYFKRKDYSLAVLTNWFSETQIPRLKKAGLLEFFDQVYTGDKILKPRKEAYFRAVGDYDPLECVFIGDCVNRDYIGPRACGMHSILYDKNNVHHKTLQKVKRLDELKEKY